MASSSKKSAAKTNLFGKREPEDALETKPILKKHKEKSEEKETTEGFVDSLQTKSAQANLISVKETVEGLDETPDFVEKVAGRKKTLFVTKLARRTEISDMCCKLKKDGERLCGRKFFLDVAEIATYPLRPKYNLGEKLWYEATFDEKAL